MEIFLPGLNLRHRLDDLVKLDIGYSFCLQALTREFTKELANEVSRGPFEEFFDVSTGVFQKFDVFSPDYFTTETSQYYPLMRELGDSIGQLVRANAGKHLPLQTWQPNDIAIQRYSGQFDSIGRHRDFESDIVLIASFTVCGTGAIGIYESRQCKQPKLNLQTGPGSLLLQVAPGLRQVDHDIRVTHSVPPPICGPRISVTYRLATQPGKKGVDKDLAFAKKPLDCKLNRYENCGSKDY